jgi:MYXO-CTERM domain-containing protein
MVRPVNRDTVLWTLVLFFGASIMFGAIRNATEDESAGVSLGLQLFAGLLLVGAVILFVRRRR